MQFIDLNAQQQRIRPQIDAAIKRVLDHGKYIMGPEVLELEGKLAEFAGVKHCIGVASGTDALLMTLMAYGIGPGDAIFTGAGANEYTVGLKGSHVQHQHRPVRVILYDAGVVEHTVDPERKPRANQHRLTRQAKFYWCRCK